MNEKRIRQSGIELLRIFSIIGIIGLHIYGEFKNQLSGFNMYMVLFYNSLFNIGVPCFVLISGYFSIKADYRKLRKIHLMMLLYAFLDYGLTIFMGADFQVREAFHCLFPIFTRRHWYLTCYFVLAILSPYLNLLTEKLERKQLRNLVIVSLLVFNVLPILPDFAITNDGGKGVCQFVILYLLGRYIRIYQVNKREHRWKYLAMACVMLLITFGGNVALTALSGNAISWFASDGSITVILCAVFVFLFFESLTYASTAINKLASYVVAVYVSEATVRMVLNRYIEVTDYMDSFGLVFVVLLYALFTAIVAVVIEAVRRALCTWFGDRYVSWEYGKVKLLLGMVEKRWMLWNRDDGSDHQM